MSTRESLETKALRYVAEQRLTVTLVDAERIQARVRGGEAEHLVGYRRGGWYCDCEAHRFGQRCSHIAGLQLVTRRPERQPAGLTAARMRAEQDKATTTRNGRRSA